MQLEQLTQQQLEEQIRRLEKEHGVSDADPCSLARMPELLQTRVPPLELLRARLAAMLTW